jgi:hypothetical protein
LGSLWEECNTAWKNTGRPVPAMTEREEMQSEARHLRASIRQCWAELDKPELTPEERAKIREQVSVLAHKLSWAISQQI